MGGRTTTPTITPVSFLGALDHTDVNFCGELYITTLSPNLIDRLRFVHCYSGAISGDSNPLSFENGTKDAVDRTAEPTQALLPIALQ